ncbi:tyrosine-type recombinase/integrase [Agarivorans albus]|uniref:Putative phage integrase n=1 Tax=Agarivorans albus MKT 106 TaxID=1331007 RepID=R9PQI9_AGAAL|nr:integrase family protein [Agarivorans albus]GAD03619.1 putative phage integrase [Agarivorans albus MKT 106]
MSRYIKFSKREIDNLKPPRRRTRYRDKAVNGLILEHMPTGLCVFRVRKNFNGKGVTVTLGHYPELSPELAKSQARIIQGQLATGINPNQEKRKQASLGVTLQEALDNYLECREGKIQPRTAKQYRSVLSTYSYAWLNKPLAAIRRADIQKMHNSITRGTITWKNERGDVQRMRRPSEAQADLWARIFRTIFNFSKDYYRDEHDQPLLPENPVSVLSTTRQWHNVERKNTRIRNHQLSTWLDAIDFVRNTAEEEYNLTRVAICDALEFTLFTGLRRSEVLQLTWSRVELDGGYFWISQTKNGQELELPITESLKKILLRRKEQKNDSEYVFPNANTQKCINDPKKTIWEIEAQAEALGNPINFRSHDLRRTFASLAELAGVGTYTIKRLMNHKTSRSPDVTQGYVVFSADELRIPAEKVESYILERAGRLEADKKLEEQIVNLFFKCDGQTKKKMVKMLGVMVGEDSSDSIIMKAEPSSELR